MQYLFVHNSCCLIKNILYSIKRGKENKVLSPITDTITGKG